VFILIIMRGRPCDDSDMEGDVYVAQ
jgi:hypothetical protein